MKLFCFTVRCLLFKKPINLMLNLLFFFLFFLSRSLCLDVFYFLSSNFRTERSNNSRSSFFESRFGINSMKAAAASTKDSPSPPENVSKRSTQSTIAPQVSGLHSPYAIQKGNSINCFVLLYS